MKKVPSLKQRVLTRLGDGRRYNVAQLTIECHTSDPRGIIRDLRRQGYNVADEWVQSPTGSRFKEYWLASTPDKQTNNDINGSK